MSGAQEVEEMETAISANGRVDRNVRRQRWEWLLKETRERRFVDVLNSEFVDAYIDEFKPAHQITYWGAKKCRKLGADLAAMAKLGYLERHRSGLSSGAWQPGFPKWVWSYQPGKYADLLMSNAALTRRP